MLQDRILTLYKKLRLTNYRGLFCNIREKDGSLSATEAYTVDVIYLLGNPTVTRLAETLNISQPNATYKVNNLASKGYVIKCAAEEDRRECRLQVSERFYKYYGQSTAFIDRACETLLQEYTPEEIALFEKMLSSLTESVD